MQALKTDYDNYDYLSQFDREFYHYEANQELYSNIIPVHVTEKWMIDVECGGRMRGYKKTLSEAVELRDHFRSINQKRV